MDATNLFGGESICNLLIEDTLSVDHGQLTLNVFVLKFQCSIANGSMAIAAGICAQILEDCFGHIGPFRGAIALTALAMALVMQWDENYGEEEGQESSTLYQQFTDGWKLVGKDSKILRIGLIQALSEGGMYTVSYRLHNIHNYCTLSTFISHFQIYDSYSHHL